MKRASSTLPILWLYVHLGPRVSDRGILTIVSFYSDYVLILIRFSIKKRGALLCILCSLLIYHIYLIDFHD